uniref:Phosphatidylinositol-4-phosphate 5-kinase like 1 n=1 Tax=Neogobius melanostomus TaxID=47308 RepID=A0A8C6UF47_9GOBI
MAEAAAAVAALARRRRRWWQLRQQWSMLGVFEITADHAFFRLTTFIKEGVRASVQKGLNSAAPDALTTAHYRATDTQTHKGFSLQTLAAPVFQFLRQSLHISEEQFMNTLCSEENYLQFISNSKSKADFFITHDKRFFLKTQSRREVKFLLNKLQPYVSHLDKFPHSLLVRFLGVYQIVIPNEMKKYFIVMQSVFFPDERIDVRYDMKGCEVGRWTDPGTRETQVIKVLKDNNFQGQHIKKDWFLEQVRADTEFLQSLNVLDYSLLLAQQPLHHDELERKHSLANLVLPPVGGASVTCGSSVRGYGRGPGLAARPHGAAALSEHLPAPGNPGEIPLQEFRAHHRRLLPVCENAVHVLDGPQQRYFVGIIDVFTVYGLKKRLEHLWKTLRFRGRDFSTVSPRKYAPRFCRWIRARTD